MIYFEERKKGLAILSEDSDSAFMYARNGVLVIGAWHEGRYKELRLTPEEIDLLKRLTEYTGRRDR